jgi:hypothetical protein
MAAVVKPFRLLGLIGRKDGLLQVSEERRRG